MAASLGELIVSIAGDIAQLELAMTRAELVTARTAKKIEDAMDVANKAVVGLAAGFVGFKGLQALEDGVSGAIEAAANLERLSKQTAVSAEDLSKLNGVAKQTNTDIGAVARGLAVMSKAMVDTAAGTGKARDTLASLKLDVKDANGQLKNGADFLVEFAKKTSNLSNETQRLGQLQKVLKNSGVELSEFLEKLAVAGDLNAKVTNRQAWEAEQYEKTLIKLTGTKRDFYNMVAQQVTPVLTALVRTYIDLATGAGSLNAKTKELQQENKLREWAINAGIAVAMVIDGFRYVALGIKIMGDGIVAVGAVFIGAFDIIGKAVGTLSASLADFGQLMQGIGLIMAGQFTVGAAMIGAALGRLKAGWQGFGDDVKGDMAALGVELTTLNDDVDKMLGAFKEGQTVDVFLEQLAKVGDGFSETAKKGTDATGVVKTFKKDAIDNLTTSMAKQAAGLVTEISAMQQYGRTTKETTVATTTAVLKEMEHTGALAEHAKRTGESVEATKKRVLGFADLIDRLQATVLMEKQHIDALQKEHDLTMGVVDNIIALRDQAATYGQLASAVTRYNMARLQEKLDAIVLFDTEGKLTAELKERLVLLGQLAKDQDGMQSMKDQVSMWTELSNMAGDFAKQLVNNVGGAVQYLRNAFKQLLADIVSIMARRWVLSMIASATGDGALATLAQTTGNGSVAGGIVNMISGTSTGLTAAANAYSSGAYSAFVTGYQGGTMVGGTTVMQGANAFGRFVGQFGAVIGIAAAVIAGVATSAGLYSSGWHGGTSASSVGMTSAGRVTGTPIYFPSGEIVSFANRSLRALGVSDRTSAILSGTTGLQRLFGWKDPHADASGIRGNFTGMNFTGENYQDWSRRGGLFRSDQRGTDPSPFNQDESSFFGAFMENLKGIMSWLGNTLHVDAAQVLANYTHAFQIQLTNDGKPLSDDEVNNLLQGLVGTVLQDQLGLMFDAAGNTTLAAYVRGLKGTGAELSAAINDFLAVMSGAMQMGLKNFTVESVMAMQQDGETLGATFTRLMSDYTGVLDKFTPDSTKLVNAQTELTALYGDLSKFGYQVPATREGWLEIMKSLDMSTASGQELFERMLALAPAFDAVTSAAESMMSSFDEIMGRLRPGYTDQRSIMGRDSAVSQFMANNPWTQGMSPDFVINQISTITREDFSHYSLANQQLIVSILGYAASITQASGQIVQALNYGQLTGAGQQGASDFVGGVGGMFTGDFGTRTPNILKAIDGEIARLQGAMDQPGAVGTADWIANQAKMSQLVSYKAMQQKDLNRYWELEAVAPGHGEDLLNLDKWYADSKKMLVGNTDGLLALEAEFQKRRTDIITKGTADAATAMTGLIDWRNGLLTSSVSPLTLQQQLAVAASDYQHTLAGVQGGDHNVAGLQTDAQRYLELARQVFPSLSTTYEALFRQIMLDTGGVVGESAATTNAKLAAAIPVKSTLASAADIQVLSDSLGDIIVLLSKVIMTSDPATKSALDNVADAIKKLGQTGVLKV